MVAGGVLEYVIGVHYHPISTQTKIFFVSSRDHTFLGDGDLGALVLLLVGTPDSALDFVVIWGRRERLDHVADFFAGSARQKGSQVAGVVAKELTAAGKHGMLKG